jgi:hypothetical protein
VIDSIEKFLVNQRRYRDEVAEIAFRVREQERDIAVQDRAARAVVARRAAALVRGPLPDDCGPVKLVLSSFNRLIPAECERHKAMAVSAIFRRMLWGKVANSCTKVIKARFSPAWSGARDGRRLNSAVERTDLRSGASSPLR